MFWRNKRKIDFSRLSSDSRHSEKITLKIHFQGIYFLSFEVISLKQCSTVGLSTMGMWYFQEHRNIKEHSGTRKIPRTTPRPPPPASPPKKIHGRYKKTTENVMLKFCADCEKQARVFMGRSKLCYVWHYCGP